MPTACTHADLPAWLELRSALWPDCPAEEHVEEMGRFLAVPDRFGRFIERYEVGRPIGFVEAAIRTDYVNGTDSSPVAFLEGIYVIPRSRGREIARALVACVEAWAGRQGCTELASDAAIDHHASHLMHGALGFVETERVVFFKKALG